MEQFLNVLFAIIPLSVLVLVIYVIIQVLRRKNKGEMDYGNSSLNILDNNTTDEDEDESKQND